MLRSLPEDKLNSFVSNAAICSRSSLQTSFYKLRKIGKIKIENSNVIKKYWIHDKLFYKNINLKTEEKQESVLMSQEVARHKIFYDD